MLPPNTLLLNRYRVETPLGQGGMGVVYRAHDLSLERPVAVKVLQAHSRDATDKKRLINEALIAAKLNHPNIMGVYDAGEHEGMPFIVIELLTGQDLRQASPPTLAESLAIAQQVCAALAHAHAAGIVHRDLKAENVMVWREAGEVRVKLMDFGLARADSAPRLTEEGALVGTFAYLAPEIITGTDASPQSDLYALGVLVYELLTGQPPFVGELIAVISQHLHASVVPPTTHNPSLPPALDALLLRLLAKQPGQRPASAAEVKQTLAQIVSGTGESAGEMPVLSPLDRIGRGRFVAREKELAEAVARWRQAKQGTGSFLLISGEPGIGKTRLTRELRTHAALERAHVLVGECYPDSAPYAPLAPIVQTALEAGEWNLGLTLADLFTFAPALRARYPDAPYALPLEPQAEQQRRYESFITLLSALTTTAPVLLVVDDVHWADSGTLDVLRHLARRLGKQPLNVLVVLTYREVELAENRALHTLLLDLNRERLATRLKLGRLTQTETHDLLHAIFAEDITQEFLVGLYRETEGNPFFLEEVCKTLIESGQLHWDGQRWQRPTMAQLEIPQSVRLAVQARVEQLPEGVQEVLRWAAVLGREFEWAALQAVSELGDDPLLNALEAAQKAQLIVEVPHAQNPTFSFAHALIPATLREGLSGLRRQRLHRRAALALEKLYAAQLDERAAELGQHFAAAGDAAKAADYLRRAGDRARAVYAYATATTTYAEAVEQLKANHELARAAQLLWRLGQLHLTLFEFDQARRVYAEGFALWAQAAATPPPPLPPAPHALRLTSSDIETFDPYFSFSIAASIFTHSLFSGLVRLNEDLDIVPEVAARWEILDEGQRYRFYLRPDWRWSDGMRLTAHDFEFAWKRALDPATNAPFVKLIYALKNAVAFQRGAATAAEVGVQALDDLTLEVVLGEPLGYFLQLLAHRSAFPLPQAKLEQYGNAWADPAHLVSNGPFCLDHYVPDQRLTLRRNPHYPGIFAGNLGQVAFDLNPTFWHQPQARLDAYDKNEVDFAPLAQHQIAVEQRQQMQELRTQAAFNTVYLACNVACSPFADPRVRRALGQVIPRETLARIMGGRPATGLLPFGFPGHQPTAGLPYNPAQAQALLAEAGYANGQNFPPCEFWTYEGGWEQPFAAQLCQSWAEHLNLHITFHTQPVSRMNNLALLAPAERPALSLGGWGASYLDPENFLREIPEHLGWQRADYAALLARARRLPDLAERLTLYQEAERLLLQTALILPLTYYVVHALVKPWVHHFHLSPLGHPTLKNVVLEAH